MFARYLRAHPDLFAGYPTQPPLQQPSVQQLLSLGEVRRFLRNSNDTVLYWCFHNNPLDFKIRHNVVIRQGRIDHVASSCEEAWRKAYATAIKKRK